MAIVPARTVSQWRRARELVEHYAASLDADLWFQDYAREVADLQTHYGPPGGGFLLARVGDRYVGCVGVRRLNDNICEMKRLYVCPPYVNRDIGRALAEAIVEEARELGYARMRLDTWPSMTTARALYRRLGFKEILPYRNNPNPDTRFMELVL